MTDAEVSNGAEIPGVQADTPGVQAEITGVQADTPGVQDAIPGVQDATPGVQDEEHNIVFGTDSEYEPRNTSYTSTSDESTDTSDDSSKHSNEGTTDQHPQTITRLGRKVRINPDLFDNYQFIGVPIPPDAYTPSVQTAFGNDVKDNHARWQLNDEIIQFTFTQYSLKQGLQKFTIDGPKATMAEMSQLHDKHTFQPVHVSSLTERQRKEALESLIFIKEK
jgi:hypothetical protein